MRQQQKNGRSAQSRWIRPAARSGKGRTQTPGCSGGAPQSPGHSLGVTKLPRGPPLMAQAVKFLTGLFLDDRRRCLSITLGCPMTTWCEGAQAQAPGLWGGQSLLQATTPGLPGPRPRLRPVPSDATPWLCASLPLYLAACLPRHKLPHKHINKLDPETPSRALLLGALTQDVGPERPF